VAVNSIAVFVGYFLALNVPSIGQLAQVQVTDRMITTVMALMIGITLALSQWILIRLHIPRPTLWLLATFLGWITPIALFLAMPPASQGPQLAALFVLLGLAMGALQYLVIRPHRPNSWWWVPTSVAGWFLLAVSLPVPINSHLAFFAIGAVPAIATGMAFVLIIASKAPRKVHA
jgi:hypothetical protein